MTRQIDCRGLECPKPVVNTKQALDEINLGTITVIVDNKTSLENVRRLAKNQGHRVTVREKEGDFYLDITKEGKVEPAKKGQAKPIKSSYIIFITSDCLGTGDKRLGEILIKAFLNTIWESESKPEEIVFINHGVKLTTEGSETLETLQLLEQEGVKIISCGTCLAYYNLTKKLKVGLASNMYEIVNISGGG
jgi:selenium metabolism protein YedF